MIMNKLFYGIVLIRTKHWPFISILDQENYSVGKNREVFVYALLYGVLKYFVHKLLKGAFKIFLEENNA